MIFFLKTGFKEKSNTKLNSAGSASSVTFCIHSSIVCVSVPVCAGVYECVVYLCSLCLLVQQCQPRQILQEWVGRIKNLGQEVETFPLVVVQDLDKKTWRKNSSRWFKEI